METRSKKRKLTYPNIERKVDVSKPSVEKIEMEAILLTRSKRKHNSNVACLPKTIERKQINSIVWLNSKKKNESSVVEKKSKKRRISNQTQSLEKTETFEIDPPWVLTRSIGKYNSNIACPPKTIEQKQIDSIVELNSKKKNDSSVVEKKSRKQKKLDHTDSPKEDEVFEINPITPVTSSDGKHNSNITGVISLQQFAIGEVVFAKIKGSPHWPAKIVSFDNKRYEIFWFNDYRTSKVFVSQLFKFEINFNEFAKKFQKNIALETASNEALIFLASKEKKIKKTLSKYPK